MLMHIFAYAHRTATEIDCMTEWDIFLNMRQISNVNSSNFGDAVLLQPVREKYPRWKSLQSLPCRLSNQATSVDIARVHRHILH